MVRETSIRIYREIKQDGFLGQMQEDVVWGFVYYNGPKAPTASELTAFLATAGFKYNPRDVNSRCSELTKMGVLTELPSRTCVITGKRKLTWCLSGSLPTRESVELSKEAKARKTFPKKLWDPLLHEIDMIFARGIQNDIALPTLKLFQEHLYAKKPPTPAAKPKKSGPVIKLPVLKKRKKRSKK